MLILTSQVCILQEGVGGKKRFLIAFVMYDCGAINSLINSLPNAYLFAVGHSET